MTRPSESSAHMLSSSKRTDIGEVLMPCPFDEYCVVFHHARQLVQSACVESFAVCHPHVRVQPELGFPTFAANVNMDRLARAAFVRVEEKSEPLVAQDDWHV